MSKIRANRDAIDFGGINAGRDVICNITNITGDKSRSGPAGGSNETRQDVFRPSFYAPPNPREVLLDFGNPLNDTESATPEAKVLHEILREDVIEQKTRIVSIYGKAGVGKTCILRALGDEEFQEKFKLKEYFPGGIYFLSLGMDATEYTLIQGLAQIIRICGGEELGRELGGEEDLRIVLRKVKEWMKGKKCLVLLDDFWERNGLGGDKVREMAEILSDKSGSVLVMTTRFIDLARVGNVIRVKEREVESEEATTILLRHAKFERREIEDEEEEGAFRKALKMCGGLPLFLSVVGRGVAELGIELQSEECGRKAVWRKYWKEFQALGQYQLLDTKIDEYPDLSTTLRLSLMLLSKRRGNRLGSLCVSKLSFHEMHRALCVFKKQARIPISVCRRLWKVKSDEGAFRIGKWFAGVGLADVENKRLGEKYVEYIRLHDLVHMFAVECAEEEEGVAKWHGELLKGYLPKVRGSDVVRMWWDVCRDREGDEYLSANLCRHLVCSGNVREADGLLASGEWSKLRHEVGGLSAWKGDFRERLEGGKKDSGSKSENESEKEIEKGLEMIRDAVINSWGVVHENPGELGYQLIGRLIDCENEVVKRYLRSIEKLGRKPWLKPMQRCWDRPGEGMMIGEFHLGVYVFDIALHKKSFTAAVGVGREVVILDLQEMRVTGRYTGHNDIVWKVGISDDGRWVFSWSHDGTVRQWDVKSGEEQKAKSVLLFGEKSDDESDEDSRIRRGAFSPNMSFTVMASWMGKIRVWDLRNGERVGRTMDASERVDCIALSPNGRMVAAGLRTGVVLLCDMQTSGPVYRELKGHVHNVADIAFNGDGRLVASCAWDSTVRVWNVESKTQVGDPLVQCEEETEFDAVAFSEDSQHIFSSGSSGWIRVWSVANGAEVRSWQAHPCYGANCVTGDLASRLAVSSGSGLVRVWDLQAKPNEQNERIYSKGNIWCVVASPDGSFFVSGSDDKQLRIWDGGDGRPLGEALCGHESVVRSIAVSPDSRRIVSGSHDHTVRVWDVRRCAQVGDALRGHEHWIRCVAYSPDGEFVVSGSLDKTVRVWRVIDCENGGVGEPANKCVRVAESGDDIGLSSWEALRLEKCWQHDERVTSVAVSRDGQRVVSGLLNGEIWIWDITSGRCIDRKQSDTRCWIERIDVSETNVVVTANALNQELRWWLDNERGLTRIVHSEEGTEIARAGNQEGFVAHELNAVVCKGCIVRLSSGDQKIATLPEDIRSRAWAYNARSRVLCVGFRSGRVLFFRVDC